MTGSLAALFLLLALAVKLSRRVHDDVTAPMGAVMGVRGGFVDLDTSA
jgi:hypothetical protein